MARDDDWRLQGQEKYLFGATLLRKRYKAWSEDWDHDHCEFCWAKFMDPSSSIDAAQFIADNPEVLIEGYAVQGRRPSTSSAELMGRVYSQDGVIAPKIPSEDREDYWWVCPQCVSDFAERFEWVVLERSV